MELHVFLRRDRVPDRERWQQSIAALGLPLELDPTLDLSQTKGFSTCKLNSEDSGFEVYPDDPLQEIVTAYPSMAPLTTDFDYAVTFRWSGDMKECGCVLVAAAALVKDFQALAYFPDDDIVYGAEQLMEEAR
ncbi:MAG: hypothetical protein ACRD88_05625, partial [Terriglobia bacterium]